LHQKVDKSIEVSKNSISQLIETPAFFKIWSAKVVKSIEVSKNWKTQLVQPLVFFNFLSP